MYVLTIESDDEALPPALLVEILEAEGTLSRLFELEAPETRAGAATLRLRLRPAAAVLRADLKGAS